MALLSAVLPPGALGGRSFRLTKGIAIGSIPLGPLGSLLGTLWAVSPLSARTLTAKSPLKWVYSYLVLVTMLLLYMALGATLG